MDFSKCLYDPFDKKLLEKILGNHSLSEEFGANWGEAEPIKEIEAKCEIKVIE